MTQTTEDRIYRIMLDNETYAKASYTIAAEIDRMTAERNEARAEVERLRMPAEAFWARDEIDRAPHDTPVRTLYAMRDKANEIAARARSAKESQP